MASAGVPFYDTMTPDEVRWVETAGRVSGDEIFDVAESDDDSSQQAGRGAGGLGSESGSEHSGSDSDTRVSTSDSSGSGEAVRCACVVVPATLTGSVRCRGLRGRWWCAAVVRWCDATP